MSEEKECNQVLKGLCNCKCVKNGTYPCFIEKEFLLKQQLQTAKEENEKLKEIISERLSKDKMEVIDAKIAIENFVLREALEKIKIAMQNKQNLFRQKNIFGNIYDICIQALKG